MYSSITLPENLK